MTIAPEIHFGTAGWRGVIGSDFTFATVRQLTYAITRWWESRDWPHNVAVGYDSRFLSERFADECVAVFARYGFSVHLTHRDTPQPALAWYVRAHHLPMGLNFTGSHNPPRFSGVKLIDGKGGLLPDNTSREIEEAYLQWSTHRVIAFTYDESHVQFVDPKDAYLEYLRSLIDTRVFDHPLRIVIDPLFGTAREYLDGFLGQFPGIEIELLHSFKDPYFGGYAPEATTETVQDLLRTVREGGYDLGIATDGDGDRFGIVDRGGHFLQPEQVLTVFYHYLLDARKLSGGIVRNVATTHMLDRIARHYNQPIIQTRIGFKNMADYLWQPDILMAAEESAGFTMRPHIPDKDGILAGLLAVEIIARTGQSIREYWESLIQDFGALYQAKSLCNCTDPSISRYNNILKNPPDRLDHLPIQDVDFTDGIKMILPDDTWVLIRLAGTEPVFRVYAESPSSSRAQRLVHCALAMLQGSEP